MKRQMRCGVFETNSSSVHSLTICSEQQYNDWKNGKVLFDRWKKCFVPLTDDLSDEQKVQAINSYKSQATAFTKDWDDLTEIAKRQWFSKWAIDNDIADEDLKSYEEYMDCISYDFESFEQEYITPKGEKIVAFGYYGHD